MVITSSLVFHMLSEHYTVRYNNEGKTNIIVGTPRLLDCSNNFMKPDMPAGFYICEDIQIAKKCTASGSAFLIRGEPTAFDLVEGCDAAFILTDDTLGNIMYEVCEIIRSLQNWDLELKDASMNKTNLSQMMRVVHTVFSYPTGVVDRNYIVAGYTPDCLDKGILNGFIPVDAIRFKTPFSTINEMLLDPDFVQSLKERDAFVYPHSSVDVLLCMNIFEKDQYLARVISVIPREAAPGIYHLFRHACSYIRSIFLNYTDDVLVKRQNDKIHVLLSDLIQNPAEVDTGRLAETLEAYGWRQTHRYVSTVMRFYNTEEFNHIYLYLCNQLEFEWPGSYAIKTADEIIWIVNNNLCKEQVKGHSRRQSLSYIIRDLVCKAGSSDVFEDLSQLKLFYDQAVYALEEGMIKKPHLWYFSFTDFTLDYLISLVKPYVDSENLYHKGIRELIEHDRSSDSSLSTVLYTFITCNLNATVASEKLFMHRSTFNRQMNKIREITGVEWDKENSIDKLIHVLISLRMLYEVKP